MSQQEHDLAALALVRRKGVMLAQLAQLAADDRLAEESRLVVDWFRDEVKSARSDGRLNELTALLPQAGIRRRHWWHGRPAAIEAPGWNGEDEEDCDDEDQAAEDEDYPQAIEGVPPPRPGELTWANAMDVCGWKLTPAIDGCQVAETGQLCGSETQRMISGRYVQNAWICARHYNVLCQIINDARRPA